MNKRELEFRKYLCQEMHGKWLVAINVENRLNPGIPDLAYVMAAPGHETGWLELKSVYAYRAPKIDVRVEPSQHQWMIRYAKKVPTHFLIEVGPICYLVDGVHHNALSESITQDDLRRLARAVIERKNIAAELPTVLREVTWRGRHGFEAVLR